MPRRKRLTIKKGQRWLSPCMRWWVVTEVKNGVALFRDHGGKVKALTDDELRGWRLMPEASENTYLFRVELPRACYGLVTDCVGVVLEAAPIARWMLGKHYRECERWIKRKGGTVTLVRRPDV